MLTGPMNPDPKSYADKWRVMAAVAVGIFLATLDISIVNVALPTLVRDLGTSFAVVQWVVLAYLLTLTTLMLSVGRLADIVGHKGLYAAGFVVFVAGSALCGLSPAAGWLIGFRVLQALGAAMILALGPAIVIAAFPPHERGKALGIGGSVVSVGIVVGPALGGILIDALSWHWIFFVNVPVGIVGTWLVLRFVPSHKPEGGQRFDYGGAVLLFFGLLALLLALTLGQQWGFGDTRVFGLGTLWLALSVGFVWVERREHDPMIDLGLFRDRLLDVNLVTGYVTFVCVAGGTILLPFYLENVLGYDTRHVGFLMAAVPMALGIAAPLSGAISDRVGTRAITVLGLVVLAFAYVGLSTLDAETSTPGIVLRFAPIGLGMGIFQSPNNSAIMGAAPRGRLGIVSGLLAITRTLGQTTGVAVVGALWAARVFVHEGGALAGGATAARKASQVAGMQDTFRVEAGLVALALALGVWGLVESRRSRIPRADSAQTAAAPGPR